jgi:enoyl-CoA hydratase
MSEQHLRLDVEDHIGRIVLDRPERGHAWLAEMWTRATDMVDGLAADPAVRAILLDSEGERIFSGGADIFELASLSASEEGASDLLQRIEGLMAAIERAPQPVIAVVSGTAIGAGLEIAAAADLRIASETARFGIPAARLGIVVTRTDVARIVRMAGPALASDLLLSGRVLEAAEALAAGIVSLTAPPARLRVAATDLASRIAAMSPMALREMKRHLLAVAPQSAWGPAAFGPSIEALTSEDFRARSSAAIAERRSATGSRTRP